MSDETTEPTQEPVATPTDQIATPLAGEQAGPGGVGGPADEHATAAWHDVIAQLDSLGEAIGRWTRAAVNDPDNRQRAEELKEHVETMAHNVSAAVDEASSSAAKSDVGQAFKEAAEKTGDALKAAGERFTEEVAPRMASAFRGAAEKLHQAAERMERPKEPGDERGAEARAGGAPVTADEAESTGPADTWGE